MPDVPVTLTPWFDAKDKPPDEESAYPTDRGNGFIHPSTGKWTNTMYLLAFDPQPVWWCVPSPPDMSDPLTVEDLRLVLDEVRQRDGVPHAYWVRVAAAAARLRRALDQIEKASP